MPKEKKVSIISETLIPIQPLYDPSIPLLLDTPNSAPLNPDGICPQSRGMHR